jgi:hypothetical protein
MGAIFSGAQSFSYCATMGLLPTANGVLSLLTALTETAIIDRSRHRPSGTAETRGMLSGQRSDHWCAGTLVLEILRRVL